MRMLARVVRFVGLSSVRVASLAGLLFGLVLARGGAPVLGTALAATAAILYVALERRRPDGGFWLLYVAAFLVFAGLRQVADELGAPVRAGYVIALDGSLPGAEVPTVWLQRLAFDPGRVAWWDVVAVAVHASYFVVPHVVAFVLWRQGSQLFRRYCLALLGAVYAGLLTCLVLPTTPPWLASQEGLLPRVWHVIPGVWNRADEAVYANGEAAVGPNAVAAMPSLHMAGAVLVALVLWRALPSSRPLAVAYPAAMALTLVYTGEHYVVDVVAGAALAVAAWAWAPALSRRLAALRPTPVPALERR
jgi:membrane-associated phospholipid phosphatase